MAISNLLKTSTESLSDIIGNGKRYEVPPYQRDYSWNEDNWADLWVDIVDLATNMTVHYMGSIVLKNEGDKNYTIIDGQQRFTTLTLIVLSVIHKLNNLIESGQDVPKNKERVELLKSKFIGDKDPASLTYTSKLSLNENNDSFFQSYLLIFRDPVNARSLIGSEKRLWQAYSFFKEKVNHYFREVSDGEVITNFLNKIIAEKLLFIQIVVEDELSAYTVFETLNSRGVGLTVTDLLKNYLFSLVSEVDLRHIKVQWAKIIDQIGLDNFPSFLRHYWISKNRLISQAHLFKTIKSEVQTSELVFDLLDNLERNAQLYVALSNASDPFWIGQREKKKRVREIELFGVKQCLPILLATYEHLNEQEFEKILRIVSVISFRYTVIGKLRTNRLEDVYNSASLKISQGMITNAKEVALKLRELYPVDKDFKNMFESKSISTKRGKKMVRYILFALENQISQTDRDFETDPGTIEHILPENPNTQWEEAFPVGIQESCIFRIGNFVLLESDKNRDCERKPFDEKKEVYAESQYGTAKAITYADWTPASIDAWQVQMSNYASAVWRLPYFD